MNPGYWIVTSTIKHLSRLVCTLDEHELSKVPKTGPLIVVANHINFLDVPLLYSHLAPRPMTGFAKAETWDSRWMGALFNLWGGIPLRRGEADTHALRKGLAALAQGKILGISPEGTRSGNGCLQRGHPGVVTVATLCASQLGEAVPILPIAFWGLEHLYPNLNQLRRTHVHIRVGRPFYLGWGEKRMGRELRQAIVDEIMGQIAVMLPEANRGVYAAEHYSTRYLRFDEAPDPTADRHALKS